jgi:phospholipase/carboxylesterase
MSLNKIKTLESIEVSPSNSATSTMIWLHGLGADGNDFVTMIPELNLPADIDVRFIFPNAPIKPVTLNNGYQMRAWYDIYGLSINERIDNEGIAQSVAEIEKIIEKEVARGIPTHRIFLGGFSQGAAIALSTGLCYSKPLAGILGLSGYLPIAKELHQKANAANLRTPIFLAHGTQDPIVPFVLGQATQQFLTQANYPVSWHSYPMPHSVCKEEIEDISRWLQGILRLHR